MSLGSKALIAALLVAIAPPAAAQDTPSLPKGVAISLTSAVLVPTDGQPQNVEGGVWLSDEQALRVANRLREAGGLPPLEPDPQVSSWVAPMVIGMVLGVASGFAVGFYLR